MVDETAMNTPTHNGKEAYGEAAPRAKARDFLRDAVALAELQGRLAVVDVKDGLKAVRMSLVIATGGIALGLGCIPVGLWGIAALLAEKVPMADWQAFLIVFAVAIATAAGCVYGGWRALVRRGDYLVRSRTEWKQNVGWIKEMLKCPGGMEIERSGAWPPGK